jgi:hypothetical protein
VILRQEIRVVLKPDEKTANLFEQFLERAMLIEI